MFAQETIKVDEVAHELDETRAAIGSGVDVQSFTTDALQLHGGVGGADLAESVNLDLREVPRGLRDILGVPDNRQKLSVTFDLPVPEGTVLFTRTHPFVEKLSAYLMDTALDSELSGKVARCGAIRTRKVGKRTTVLLLRLRYQIISTIGDVERPLLAEDCQIVAFTGAPESAEWIPSDQVAELLQTPPDANISSQQAADFVSKVVEGYSHLQPAIERFAIQRGDSILQSHVRVREAAKLRSRARVEAPCLRT